MTTETEEEVDDLGRKPVLVTVGGVEYGCLLTYAAAQVIETVCGPIRVLALDGAYEREKLTDTVRILGACMAAYADANQLTVKDTPPPSEDELAEEMLQRGMAAFLDARTMLIGRAFAGPVVDLGGEGEPEQSDSGSPGDSSSVRH